ncbi:MAG: hypothetical protein IIV41_09430 [Akkermansia sp.]|nr:hypothetical protein [Akkermansia sp.]
MKKFHPGNHHSPQLSTGQRCMGWLLTLTPLLGALSLCTAAAQIPGHEPVWHDYIVWMLPHLFQVICCMVITQIPALACYWLLCKLGDTAEKRGVSRYIIWPLVVLLCALAGCELLWSITGLWVVTCPYSTLALFGGLLFLCTLGLVASHRSIIKSSRALHAIYIGLILINAFWFLHSWADGEFLTRHSIFGKSSPRASWDNPLLPADFWNPPYHSWLFEPSRVIIDVKSQQNNL